MEDEENSWVFDSLVCFLNGPVWNAPIESYIEENSLIFEPNITESAEYQKVFNDFKNLVDFMLGNFMDDIGITPQQFENACAKGTQGGVTLRFDQNIFEQIWAANDYEMFKRMMTQKNVELQLQALELIEQKYGVTPAVFLPDKEAAHGSHMKTPEKKKPLMEEEIMEEVVEQFDPKDKSNDVKEPTIVFDKNYFIEEKHTLEEKLQQAFKENKIFTDKKDEKKIATQTKQSAEINTELTKTISPTISKSTNIEVDSVEMKKRQEYLRAQRDKLVALKKEVRKKHLLTNTVDAAKGKTNVRPKSAKKAAESILEGAVAPVDTQELAIRRALVEKFKSEVITKNV